MNTSLSRSSEFRQRGFISLIAVLVLTLVVGVVLKQTMQISSTKALTSLQHSDSVAALTLAQSGTEIAIQKLSAQFKSNPDLTTVCTPTKLNLTLENGNLNTTPSAFTLMDAKMASGGGYCKIRVQGTLRSASRTIETWVKASLSYGTAGFGTTPKMELTNTWTDAKAIGLFNTGWAVRDSDGHTGLTGNVGCTDCQTDNELWYNTLTGSGNDIGGAGNYSVELGVSGSSSPPSTTSYTHTLEQNRNYVMVGHVLGGSPSTAPSILGSLSGTNNNNDQGTTTSITVSAAQNWCQANPNANALVIGVAGKGTGITNGLPNLSGQFTSATFSYAGDTGPGVSVAATALPSKNYVHYPDANVNSGLTTPIAWGDVFAELYYYYQAPINLTLNAKAKSGDQTLTIDTTYATNTLVGRYLQPSSAIPNGTRITGNSGTSVTLSGGVVVDINKNSSICTGICGFFPSGNTNMTIQFGKVSGQVAKAWISGIACLTGVNDAKVKPVSNASGVTVMQWHEVLSNDPTF